MRSLKASLPANLSCKELGGQSATSKQPGLTIESTILLNGVTIRQTRGSLARFRLCADSGRLPSHLSRRVA